MFPVETRYLGRDPTERIEDQVVRAVERALAEETAACWSSCRARARSCAPPSAWPSACARACEIAPLYGALDPRDQDRAIQPAPDGHAQGRAGHLHRRDQPDHPGRARGDRLRPGPRAALRPGQRPDPAGHRPRQPRRRRPAPRPRRPHRARRLLPPVGRAETRGAAGLSPTRRSSTPTSRAWPSTSPAGAPRTPPDLAFLDPPPAAAFAEARALLSRLEALDDGGVLTAHGRALADMPLAPRLAHMVPEGRRHRPGARAPRASPP